MRTAFDDYDLTPSQGASLITPGHLTVNMAQGVNHEAEATLAFAVSAIMQLIRPFESENVLHKEFGCDAGDSCEHLVGRLPMSLSEA